MQNSLRTRLTIIFIGLAIGPLLVVGFILAQRSFVVEREQALELQQQIAQRVSAEIDSFFTDLTNDLDLLVSEVRNLEQPDQAQQLGLLLGALSSGPYRDVYEEFALLDGQGQEQLRLSRDEIIPEEELGDRSGTAEFEQPRTTGDVYISPVWFDETGVAFITIAVPFSEPRSVELKGILVVNIRFKRVSELISKLQVDRLHTLYVVDPVGQVVAHRNSSLPLQELQFELPQSDSSQTGLDGTDVVLGTDDVELGDQELTIVAERLASVALKPATDTVRTLIWILLGALIIAAALGLLVIRQIVQPIEAMSTTAQAISAGDLSQQVNITSRDEIGTLAKAFDSMTTQLRQSIDTLEQQVAARTQRLEVVATLSERLTAILDFDQLLTELVERVKETFGYYHAHVYILDEATQSLVMTAGAGDAGAEMKARGHRIALNAPTSLVAQSARAAEIVWVSNVRENEAWLPNPLLPDTYSEMAIPIIVDNQMVGVLDVQEDKVAGLDEGDANLLRSLANQVATAIRNARLFAHRRATLYLQQEDVVLQASCLCGPDADFHALTRGHSSDCRVRRQVLPVCFCHPDRPYDGSRHRRAQRGSRSLLLHASRRCDVYE